MTDTSMTPGCFGSALTFKEGSVECKGCPFNVDCQPLHEASLIAIRKSLGIHVKPKLARVKKDESVGASLTPALPKKVEELMNRIDRDDVRVVESFRNKVNPFKERPAFMKIICHILLKVDLGVSEKLLRQALMTRLNWSEGTAISHVTQARQLLLFYRVVDYSDGHIKLRSVING